MCTKHPEKNISWICFEKDCNLRVMCNVCAVKFHPHEHKVEELDSISKKGILNILSNIDEQFDREKFLANACQAETKLEQEEPD